MSNRRLSSPYFRYLKARLLNLTRPSFWGTAIFLSVIGLTIREFWMRPNILTSGQSKPVATQPQLNSTTLSTEDRAIAADIDNLSILEHDSGQGTEPTVDTPEPIFRPREGNQNPLQEAIKNQNNSTDTKLNTNSSVDSKAAPSFKYSNPFLTQAENLLQFGNPLRNGNSQFAGLNTYNPSNQASSTTIENGKSNNYTQRIVAANSLESILNQSSSINQLQNQTVLSSQTSLNQTPLNQTISRNQAINQPANLINTTSNINSLSQGFAQPFVSSINLPTNLPTTQFVNYTLPTQTQFAQPVITQPQLQPQTVYSNNSFNGANPTQPQSRAQAVYNQLKGINSTQPQTYTNFNSNSYNTQPLPNSTLTPQTTSTVNTTINTTVTPNTSNTTFTPNNTAGNGTLINPSVQQPSVAPQYPNSGLPVRY